MSQVLYWDRNGIFQIAVMKYMKIPSPKMCNMLCSLMLKSKMK
jgi:hypothetical protein